MKNTHRPSRIAGSIALVASLAWGAGAHAAPFSYDPAGTLVPAKSGKGRVDSKVYAPTMRFPMEVPTAFANSQVYGNGGGQGTGGQCDAVNYNYPWHDNYCESRSYSMPLCPAGTGHQGQDIRPGTCVKDTHWVVAALSGSITSVGSYSVYLTAADGTRFDYLHMSSVQVKVGDKVTRGQRIGKVSNVFGGTPTTIHLHMNIRQNVAGLGQVFVPPYLSLVESYKRANGILPEVDAGNPDARASDSGIRTDGGIEEPEDDAGELPNPDEEPIIKEEPGAPPPVAAAPDAQAEVEEGCNTSGDPPTTTIALVIAGVVAVAVRSRRSRGARSA